MGKPLFGSEQDIAVAYEALRFYEHNGESFKNPYSARYLDCRGHQIYKAVRLMGRAQREEIRKSYLKQPRSGISWMPRPTK